MHCCIGQLLWWVVTYRVRRHAGKDYSRRESGMILVVHLETSIGVCLTVCAKTMYSHCLPRVTMSHATRRLEQHSADLHHHRPARARTADGVSRCPAEAKVIGEWLACSRATCNGYGGAGAWAGLLLLLYTPADAVSARDVQLSSRTVALRKLCTCLLIDPYLDKPCSGIHTERLRDGLERTNKISNQ